MKFKFSLENDELVKFLEFFKKILDCVGIYEWALMSIQPDGDFKLFHVMFIESNCKNPNVIRDPINFLFTYRLKSEHITLEKANDNPELDNHATLTFELKELKQFINHLNLAITSGLLKQNELNIFRYIKTEDNSKCLEFRNQIYKIRLPCFCFKDEYVRPDTTFESDDYYLRLNLLLTDFKSMAKTLFNSNNLESILKLKFTIKKIEDNEFHLMKLTCDGKSVSHILNSESHIQPCDGLNLDKLLVTFPCDMLETVVNFSSKLEVEDCMLVLGEDEKITFTFQNYFNEDSENAIIKYSLQFTTSLISPDNC
jgi:hypothetical protein